MTLRLSRETEAAVAREVAELSEQSVFACYQCGKCSAACPVAFAMDVLPHQIFRLVQLREGTRLMQSQAPWLCIGCLSCTTLCPKGLDPARLMEAVRKVHLRRLSTPFGSLTDDARRLAALPQSAVVAAMRKVTW